MDVTPIISQLYSTLWYLVPLALLVGISKSPWFKGILGEFQVNLLIRFLLPKDTYHLLKNITFPTENGTTQIDHILVSKYGVFIIETKNMKGWIFGSANQKQWTQKIFRHTSKFQNPIHQNYKHVKTLESCLNIPAETIFSVIVFIGDSTFKTAMPSNVTYAGGCIKYVKSKKSEVLSQGQIRDVIATIQAGRLKPSMKVNRAHVAHVKEIVESKKNNVDCPKCGSSMLIRETKKGANVGGSFWGCSMFPKCRGIVKIA